MTWYNFDFKPGSLVTLRNRPWVVLPSDDAELLLLKPTQNMEKDEQVHWLTEEMQWVMDETTFRHITDPVALQQAQHLVESHTRFKQLVSGNNYKVVEPVLPMDVLGIYFLLPEVK